MAQVRVNLDQQRTDNDEMKKNLETKDDKLREMKKEQDNIHNSASLCKTELVCRRFHICIGQEMIKRSSVDSHTGREMCEVKARNGIECSYIYVICGACGSSQFHYSQTKVSVIQKFWAVTLVDQQGFANVSEEPAAFMFKVEY